MSLISTTTINYDGPTGFTYDTDKIDITVSGATLNPIDNPSQTFNQPFTSSTGFTFDPAKTEFVAGKCQQKDVTPANSTCGATYTTDINLSWGGGVLTGTATGGAGVSGGKLDLKGGTKYVTYDPVSNADSAQTGTWYADVTPNYSGTPGAKKTFFTVSKSGGFKNYLYLYHNSDGKINIQVYDSSSIFILNGNFGTWSPTSGVSYRLQFVYDFTTGATKLYIDDAQKGATQTGTGTRDTDVDTFRIGADRSGTNITDSEFDNLLFFSAVKAATTYTVPETRYESDLITLPDFVYSDVGNIQSFDGFTTTQTGSVRFNVDGQYWTGAAWASSDDSYAQMNSPADINTNIGTLGAVDTVTIKARTTTNGTQEDIDVLDVEYTGQIYPTDDPTVLVDTELDMDALDSFAESGTKAGSDEFKYIQIIDGVDKYWSGAAWVTSDGTYAQSNTAAEVQTNKAALDLSLGVKYQLKAFIHSDDGSTTPNLVSNTIGYDVYYPITPPNQCNVYGYVLDNDGSGVEDAVVTVSETIPFLHGNNLIALPATINTDVNGYWEMDLVETETISKTVRFNFKYSDTLPSRIFDDVTIPDQNSAAFNTIVPAS